MKIFMHKNIRDSVTDFRSVRIMSDADIAVMFYPLHHRPNQNNNIALITLGRPHLSLILVGFPVTETRLCHLLSHERLTVVFSAVSGINSDSIYGKLFYLDSAGFDIFQLCAH